MWEWECRVLAGKAAMPQKPCTWRQQKYQRDLTLGEYTLDEDWCARPPPSCFGWSGERWRRGSWPCRRATRLVEWLLGSLGFSAAVSIHSSVSTTSFIDGRCFCSDSMHFRAREAIWNAALDGYFPSNLESIMFFNFLFSDKNGFIQSTKLCFPLGRLISSARNPVSISIKTTPKPYTSLFTYRCPVPSISICQSLCFTTSWP